MASPAVTATIAVTRQDTPPDGVDAALANAVAPAGPAPASFDAGDAALETPARPPTPAPRPPSGARHAPLDGADTSLVTQTPPAGRPTAWVHGADAVRGPETSLASHFVLFFLAEESPSARKKYGKSPRANGRRRSTTVTGHATCPVRTTRPPCAPGVPGPTATTFSGLTHGIAGVGTAGA